MRKGTLLKRTFLFFAIAMIIVGLAEANAQVKKMSIQELTDESTAILVGKCTGKQSAWNDKHNQIYTLVTIQAGQYVKGNLGAEAVITVPGGQVGDILYEVSDMPVFEEGEESLVFIWKHPSGKLLVTGAHHGKLRIVKDKKSGASSLQGGVLEFNPDAGKAIIPQSPSGDRQRIQLDDFIRTVKNYVKDK